MLGLLILAWGTQASAKVSDVTRQLEEQSARRDQVRKRIDGLQKEMLQTRGQHEELVQQLAVAERQIGAMAQSLGDLGEQLVVLKQELKALQNKQDQEQRFLEHEQDLLDQQIRSAYIAGRQERLRILLNQQDPALLSRALAYYDYFNRARAQRVLNIQQRIDTLTSLSDVIKVRESELSQLQQDRVREKLALEKLQVGRQTIISRLSQDLTQSGAVLEQLKQDEIQLNVLLQGIRQVLQDLDNPQQQPFHKLRGKLPWPASGQIKAAFGAAKIGSLRWDGVIISASEGRKLRAVHAGRVAYADWLRGYGLLLIIDHGDAYMSLYGHNQSLFKETGDWVESGDVIGLVGSSGGQSSAGIYFGIRHDGKALNPARWCKKGRGKRVG